MESNFNQSAVKFVAVGRITDNNVILTHIPDASNKVYKDEVRYWNLREEIIP